MRLLLLFLLVFCCSVSTSTMAKTSVWTITKDNHVVYIGGTIHLLKPSDFPYPKPFDVAYQQAEQVVFETDISAASSPEFGMKMMQVLMSSDRPLKDRLSPSVFKALTAYLKEQDVPVMQFNSMTPALAALSLAIQKYRALGYQAGVDDHYFKLASRDGKAKYFFETPEEQLEFISSINSIDADDLMLSTLNDLEKLDSLGNDMTRAWREGDTSSLFALIGDMKADYPAVYDVMLTKRNQRWLSEIEVTFDEQKPTLILVGALHLAGPDSVLTMLEARGYSVEYKAVVE